MYLFEFHRFAKKNQLPVLQHVTLPRVGALKVIIDNLTPQTTANKDSLTPQTTANGGSLGTQGEI